MIKVNAQIDDLKEATIRDYEDVILDCIYQGGTCLDFWNEYCGTHWSNMFTFEETRLIFQEYFYSYI